MTAPPLPASFLARPLAHRALHDRSDRRPENSRAAIRAAVDAGVGVEIDLQLSADAVAMVFHDATLDRLTAIRGAVRSHTADALSRVALTDGEGEGIATLAEILEIIGGRVPVLIELKHQKEHPGVLEAATAHALARYAGPVAIMSFDPGMVWRMGRLAPHVPRGLTTPLSHRRAPTLIGEISDLGAAFISHDHRKLHRPEIGALKARGVPVLCWTIRTPQEESRARRVADGITFEGYLPTLKA